MMEPNKAHERPGFPAGPPRRSWIGALARGLWRGLTHDVLRKLAALLLAALLWSILIASDVTLKREKIFQDTELSVSGQETLLSNGLIVMDNLMEMLPTVQIRADVPQDVYDRTVGSYFNPRLDFSRVQEPGEQEVPITTTSSGTYTYGEVLEVRPASVLLNIERYRTRGRIPVEVEGHGMLRDGIWMDAPQIDPQMVSVAGPATLLRIVAPKTFS